MSSFPASSTLSSLWKNAASDPPAGDSLKEKSTTFLKVFPLFHVINERSTQSNRTTDEVFQFIFQHSPHTSVFPSLFAIEQLWSYNETAVRASSAPITSHISDIQALFHEWGAVDVLLDQEELLRMRYLN